MHGGVEEVEGREGSRREDHAWLAGRPAGDGASELGQGVLQVDVSHHLARDGRERDAEGQQRHAAMADAPLELVDLRAAGDLRVDLAREQREGIPVEQLHVRRLGQRRRDPVTSGSLLCRDRPDSHVLAPSL